MNLIIESPQRQQLEWSPWKWLPSLGLEIVESRLVANPCKVFESNDGETIDGVTTIGAGNNDVCDCDCDCDDDDVTMKPGGLVF